MLFPDLYTPTDNSGLLVEKYRPRTVSGFIGLNLGGRGAKPLCEAILANPHPGAYLFSGPSGTGKTSMALALAEQLHAELHHVASSECDAAAVARIRNLCHHLPAPGCTMHLVIVDEADEMTRTAQTLFLSLLDSTRRLPNTIIIFTANETKGLHPRFLSRCEPVRFYTKGLAEDAAKLLADIWAAEAPRTASAPNFPFIVKTAKTNVRQALQELQSELKRARLEAAA